MCRTTLRGVLRRRTPRARCRCAGRGRCPTATNLEAATAHFGHNENQLVKRVEGLITDGLITAGFGDVLHLVRRVGNLGAHAADERVDDATARAVLGLSTHRSSATSSRSPPATPRGVVWGRDGRINRATS